MNDGPRTIGCWGAIFSPAAARARRALPISAHGIFITLEGIEGSGKTSQVPAIVDYLNNRGLDCVVTREPGGTAIGQAIRKILLAPGNRGLDTTAELLLYMADRAQHIDEVIRPALAAGKVVICDRYADATVAYQGYARGLDLGLIRRLHETVLGRVMPDLTLLLDLAVQTGLSRAWKQIDAGGRDGEETRFEEESLNFHQRVRDGYLELARQMPDRFRVIDAAGDFQDVHRQICRAMGEVLELGAGSRG